MSYQKTARFYDLIYSAKPYAREAEKVDLILQVNKQIGWQHVARCGLRHGSAPGLLAGAICGDGCGFIGRNAHHCPSTLSCPPVCAG